MIRVFELLAVKVGFVPEKVPFSEADSDLIRT